MIFEMCELIPWQKKSRTKDHGLSSQNTWQNDIETSWSSLKSWAARGNTVDPGKENKLYSD